MITDEEKAVILKVSHRSNTKTVAYHLVNLFSSFDKTLKMSFPCLLHRFPLRTKTYFWLDG